MKHKISTILTVVVILSLLTGCDAAGKQSSTVAENEKGTVLTVRIENKSAVNLYSIAARYRVNDITLGSKVCEQINNNTGQVVYEFDFVLDELPTTSIDSFRLDVFTAEKAGEDFSDCGSAVINSPQPGGVYTLVLNGEKATALTLSTAEEVVEILPPCSDGANGIVRTEAVGVAVNWALQQPSVTCVEAETEPDNRASQRVLGKFCQSCSYEKER